MRTTFFFMVFVIFSGPFVTVAEQLSVSEQAKIDAEAHAKLDTNFSMYLVGGIGLGITSGYVCILTGANLSVLTSGDKGAPFLFFGSFGTLVTGLLGASALHHKNSVYPPPQRLIGKSPEYVTVYAKAYREKMRSLRARYLVAGAGVGCVFMACFTPYILNDFWEYFSPTHFDD